MKGLNKRIITQPAKFCKVQERAIPIASQAAPRIAINEVVSIQSIQAALKISKTFKIAEIIDSTNFVNALSIFDFFIALSTIFSKKLIILNQIHKVINAQKTFGA